MNRVPAGSGATGSAVASFQGYLTLPSDDSESEIEMEGQQAPQPDNMAIMMGQLQQLLPGVMHQFISPVTVHPQPTVLAIST